MTAVPLSVVVLSDFNGDLFAGLLENGEGEPALKATAYGYGQALSALAGEGTGAAALEAAEVAVVWTRPEAVSPGFARRMQFEDVAIEVLLDEVRAYAAVLRRRAERMKTLIVPTWVRPPRRASAATDMRPGLGTAYAIHKMNATLAEALDGSNVVLLEASDWLSAAGAEPAFATKRWYLGKLPFASAVFKEAAASVRAVIHGRLGKSRKLVIVDLDDTLWGGIVGDDGWENLRLGGHDAVGEAMVDFQRALKALARRGVLLGIVSKNTETVALEAIDQHPEMVLRRPDFAGYRINWEDKARNIVALTKELNLGLQSVVFLDDSAIERGRVREALPEVLVPEWPKDKTQYADALLGLRCFEWGDPSEEDRRRTELYATERERQVLRESAGSSEEWAASLEVVVEIAPLDEGNRQRAVQLLNKTNQVNLRTRRMTEPEYVAWATARENRVLTFTVSDRFGPSGLTGVLGVRREGDVLRIEDFVLSCRVMGRRVEETMLRAAVSFAREAGATAVVAEYVATAKNAPCLEFLRRSGMRVDEGGATYRWSVGEDYPLPPSVTVR